MDSGELKPARKPYIGLTLPMNDEVTIDVKY